MKPGNRVSFVLIWLFSSALGLITAPLVEPRYFLLPWIIWRLHVTPTEVSLPKAKDTPVGQGSLIDQVVGFLTHNALWLETIWSLFINMVTMYIFLNWGFEWKQEPGAVQRFMW